MVAGGEGDWGKVGMANHRGGTTEMSLSNSETVRIIVLAPCGLLLRRV